MSYVRKGVGLHSQQVYPLSSHDLMVLRLSKTDRQSIDIWNIYNAPPGSLGTNILQSLRTLATATFRNNCLLQGDFNLHHTWWQPSWPRSPSPGAQPFVDWINSCNFSLLSPPDKPTHNRGNVLDLAFGVGPLLVDATCRIPPHINSTSDHLPLATIVPWERSQDTMRRLRLDTLDETLFTRLLTVAISRISALSPSPPPQALDSYAEQIIEAVRDAYAASAQRSLGHGKGNPWWDKTCKDARRQFKQSLRANLSEDSVKEVRKAYQKTIKRAKESFFSLKDREGQLAKRDIFCDKVA